MMTKEAFVKAFNNADDMAKLLVVKILTLCPEEQIKVCSLIKGKDEEEKISILKAYFKI